MYRKNFMNLFKTKFFVFTILILIWSCDNQMNEEFPDGPEFVEMTWYQEDSTVFLLTLETNSVEAQTVGNFFSVSNGEMSVTGSHTASLNYLFYNPNTGAIFISNHPFGDEPDSSYIVLFTINSDTASLLIEENGNTLEYHTDIAEFNFEPTTLTFSVDDLSFFTETKEVLISGNLSISKTIEIESSSPTTLSWAEETILLPTIDNLRLAFALDHTLVRSLTFDNIPTSYPGNWTFDGDNNIAVTEIGSNGVQLNPYNVYWNQSTNTMTTNFQFDVDELIQDLEYNFGLKTGTLDAALWNVDVTFSDEK